MDLSTIRLPAAGSHKGQNGRLLVIGGSELFHAAGLWALEVASRIVDLVHYCSTEKNNAHAKSLFRNGIVVPRADVEAYIQEDDCVLIGPGMTRDIYTKRLTNRLLRTYPTKQWVIDAGALQTMDKTLIPEHAILTPHHGEYAHVFGSQDVVSAARIHNCIVLLKGQQDVASDGVQKEIISGGNEGMTKGGTGDVLAGLIAALACMNDPFTATVAGSMINKAAGDELYKTVGPFFNASDLASQIPKTMKQVVSNTVER